jgi:hypothetical protein
MHGRVGRRLVAANIRTHGRGGRRSKNAAAAVVWTRALRTIAIVAVVTLLQMDLRKKLAAMNNQHSQLFLCDLREARNPHAFQKPFLSALGVPTSSME